MFYLRLEKLAAKLKSMYVNRPSHVKVVCVAVHVKVPAAFCFAEFTSVI